MKHAIINNELDVVERLLKVGFSIENMIHLESTPLNYAASNGQGQTGILRFLIEAGANIEARDIYSDTPLMHACVYGFLEIASVLLENGALVDGEANKAAETPLYFTAFYGHLGLAELLITNGADIERRGGIHSMPPLVVAAEKDHLDVARALLSCGANVDSEDETESTALSIAASFGHLEMARQGISPSLPLLAYSHRPAATQFYQHKHIGCRPLMLAVRNAMVFSCRLMIQNGANLEAKNERDMSPLLLAVYNDRSLELVRLLVESGADVNTISTKEAWVSPLWSAAKYDASYLSRC